MHGANRYRVTFRAETYDDRSGNPRYKRIVIKRLALMNVRNVQLDNRPRKHLSGVEQRQQGERVGSRIDNDAAAFIDHLVDPLDQLCLAVCLSKLDGLPRLRCGT